mgnify:CR=1 FL=1
MDYKKKYLKYKKKYLNIKKITGGKNSKIKDYFNNVRDYFYNKICNNHKFCENITSYRVVYNDVYFYNNNNGKMVKSNEIATLNNTWDGTLVFIDNNIYVDYINMKEALIVQCLEILKRNDVKSELKNLMAPLIDMILIELYPYIYLSLIFVIVSFLLHLGIFILLLRNKSNFRIF